MLRLKKTPKDNMMKLRLKGYVPRLSIIRFVEKIPVQSFRFYIPRCCDCKYANSYNPYFTYPYFPPKCSVHHKGIMGGQKVCEDFERIGRLSR